MPTPGSNNNFSSVLFLKQLKQTVLTITFKIKSRIKNRNFIAILLQLQNPANDVVKEKHDKSEQEGRANIGPVVFQNFIGQVVTCSFLERKVPGQTEHSAANGLSPQQHFIERNYIEWRNDAEAGPANSSHVSAYSTASTMKDLI